MLDLFSALDAPPPRPSTAGAPKHIEPAAATTPASVNSPTEVVTRPAAGLPAVPIAWERLLARAPGVPIIICVSTLYTGVVREVLSSPETGRRALYKEGAIVELGGLTPPSRDVHLTREQALALASGNSLVLAGRPGRTFARFLFVASEPCDVAAVVGVLDRLVDGAAA